MQEQEHDSQEWSVARSKPADERAIDPLVGYLRGGGETELRRTAAVALGQYDDPRAVQALAEAVTRDWDIEVRRLAAEALGREGSSSAVPPLIKALGDGAEAVRDAAEQSLGRVGPAAVTGLLDALVHRNLTIRCGAALALGRIADPRAIAPLLDALRAPDYEDALAQAAARALGRIADRLPDPQLRNALPLLRRLAPQGSLYRDVLRRIESSTADVRRLPIPAAPVPVSSATLPIPAQPALPSPDGLPIPASAAPNGDVSPPRAGCPWADARWRRVLRQWIGRE